MNNQLEQDNKLQFNWKESCSKSSQQNQIQIDKEGVEDEEEGEVTFQYSTTTHYKQQQNNIEKFQQAQKSENFQSQKQSSQLYDNIKRIKEKTVNLEALEEQNESDDDNDNIQLIGSNEISSFFMYNFDRFFMCQGIKDYKAKKINYEYSNLCPRQFFYMVIANNKTLKCAEFNLIEEKINNPTFMKEGLNQFETYIQDENSISQKTDKENVQNPVKVEESVSPNNQEQEEGNNENMNRPTQLGENLLSAQQKNSRYFLNNPYIQCRRCKEVGHFEKNCIKEALPFCIICSLQHNMSDCKLQICFNCSSFNHKQSQCPLRNSKQKCFNCQKKGHIDKQCGVINFNFTNNQRVIAPYKEIPERLQIQPQNLICFNCNQIGHANCTKLIFNDNLF